MKGFYLRGINLGSFIHHDIFMESIPTISIAVVKFCFDRFIVFVSGAVLRTSVASFATIFRAILVAAITTLAHSKKVSAMLASDN